MSLEELQAQLRTGGCNKHDQVITLIAAFIDDGGRPAGAILDRLVALGYDRAHAQIILVKNAGTDPNRHPWQQNADGTYGPNSA